MPESTDPSPQHGHVLALQPARLRLDSYPLREEHALRYSDLDGGRVGRIGLAHIFESLRSSVFERVIQDIPTGQPPWQALLRNVTLEFLAPGDDRAAVQVGGAVSAVGRSSQRTAFAAFQHGQCLALGEATNVTIGVDKRPAPIPPAARERLMDELLVLPGDAPSAADPPALASLADYAFRVELPTRFADTDAVGHLNNVAISRYHDNALMAFQRAVEGRHSGPGEHGHWRLTRHVVAMSAENFHHLPMAMGLNVIQVGEHHFSLLQALFQNGQCSGTAQCEVACEDADGALIALPAELRQRLQRWQSDPDRP